MLATEGAQASIEPEPILQIKSFPNVPIGDHFYSFLWLLKLELESVHGAQKSYI